MTQLNLTPKYTLILLIVFVSFFNLQAQPKQVNYKKIEKSINNKSSPFYYPNLFSRFLANDTTLSLNDYHHLYYGYSFQDEYNPYWRSSNIEELNKIYQKKSLSQKDYQRLINLSNEILSKSPFNLDAILNNLTAYEEISEIEISKKWFYKYDKIITTILSSGDGITKETAMHVISTRDEYIIINVLGFTYGGNQSLIKGNYDYLTLKQNEFDLKGFYFSVERLFAHLESN